MNEFLKKTCLIFFLYVNYFRVSCGETIHYTNSPRHLGISENYTSYKLEVPGSAPITVIEANRGPVGANQGIRGVQQRDWIEKAEILHRRKNSKAGMLDRKDSAEVHQLTEELDQGKKTVYSPDLLKKFLQDYAERIRNAQNGGSGGENRPLHDTTISHERLNDYVTVNEMDENEDEERKEKYSNVDANWAVDHNKYHDRDRNTGWVSLEPIPWSTTKISKWQSNNHKYSSRPSSENHHNTHYGGSSSSWINDDEDYDYVDNHDQRPFNIYRPHQDKKPWNHRPRPPTYDYSGSSSPHKPWHNHDSNRPYSSDIVTDNRPANFPKFPNYQKRPSNYDKYVTDRNSDRYQTDHPNNHPLHGDGEWILISTTKGYHFPRHDQRAMAVNQPNMLPTGPLKVALGVAPHNIADLTSDNIELNVSPTAQVHDQESVESQENTIIKNKKKILRAVHFPATKPQPDRNAVLAAVAAGMVPATVAMLAPMVLG